MRATGGRDRGLILVLFDDAPSAHPSGSSRRGLDGRMPQALVDRVHWHSRMIERAGCTPVLMLPERFRETQEAFGLRGKKASFAWYEDESSFLLPEAPDGSQVYIVNGTQEHWALFDLDTVRTVPHPRNCDVLVLEASANGTDTHYSELLEIDEDGSVVRCRRRYGDSPAAVDHWTGSVAALVCRKSLARPVIAHLIAQGWGLDSIGRLTRRFRVRWDHVRGKPSMRGKTLTNGIQARRRDVSFEVRQAEPASDQAGRGSVGAANGVRVSLARTTEGAMSTNRPGGGNGTHQGAKDQTRHIARTNAPLSLLRTQGVERASPAIVGSERLDVATSESLRQHNNRRPAYEFFKRLMDIVASATALAFLSVPLSVVAILVRATSKGPALFGHKRQGLNGREFGCLKYRTMVQGADAMQALMRADNEVDGPQFKIADDPRLTRLGAWLRRYNVDELPQLFNVLWGDMSLVGPRPSPDDENQFCPGWRRARLSVRPGITGLWQIMRLREESASDFQEWIYYDLEYVRHRSLWLDWQILLHTPTAVLAPSRLERFRQRLKERGICAHSHQLRREKLVSPEHMGEASPETAAALHPVEGATAR